MTVLARLLRHTGGASAAEFAMVLPLAILFLLGLIDAGRFMWEYNRAEKATQMGVRYAVATNPVAGQGFANFSFSINGGVQQGLAVPTSAFDNVVCDGETGSCTCTGGAVCNAVVYDATAFANIVGRMAAMYPMIASENVEIEYRNVGLGYAGAPDIPDPTDGDCPTFPPYPANCTTLAGADVASLVTVRLVDLSFQPLTTLFFGVTLAMPDFSAALTLEDGAGNVSN